MPSDKDRLYVALYAHGGAPTMPGLEDTYHWALMLGPKIETENSKGARYHALEKIRFVGESDDPVSTWEYDERESSLLATSMLLVRVIFAKVKDRDRSEFILRNIPIRAGEVGWNCVGWVKKAIETALSDKKALGPPKNLNWDSIRDTAMWYVEKKKAAHRFDGRVKYDQEKAATWDMFDGVELVP
ncbi:uncharacterized protein F5Z01DRAFT_637460 [Emericellopsis atlantica]|uniref:Uncharacterized protein n=1 Tax=Emericellopsis atlantica TaxID=2614577 RepID=A0A9P8CPY1_9HYPO|nr:uncharacterized protein F5Z01DRAFT_637460 [Emericellopsis atlantica]KAG9253201.1 hypothetical protein F5Z01DRAFT_637460 [Emericellopsis atlantica]